jgi:hypothetical protein
MTSSNAEKAAAGRGLALKAAAAVSKTGVLQQLCDTLQKDLCRVISDMGAARNALVRISQVGRAIVGMKRLL